MWNGCTIMSPETSQISMSPNRTSWSTLSIANGPSAGPLTAAIGAEYRRDEIVGTTDPVSPVVRLRGPFRSPVARP